MMNYLLLTLLVGTSASFLARVRNHWEEKTNKPECHIEFEDVTEPHCETTTEQVCWEDLKNQCKTEYSTSCQTEYNTQCKTEFEELCELVEREQCRTELEEQCHDETSQECTTEYDEVCSIDYAESCHQEWVEKCKEVPDCRTEWQEECQPKSTKWKRHAIDEMETADVEEDSLEGRHKRSLATAAAVFGAGAVKATVVGAAAGAAIGGVVVPGAVGYGLGRKVGAGAKKLMQIKSDLVQRKRDRFGRSVDELAEEEIVDLDTERLSEVSEGAEEERGTAAEAISRQKRTIPNLAALGAAAVGAVPLVAAPLVAAVGAGPLVAGHLAKKLGFKAGLHHALKGTDVKQALVKKPKAKVEKDPVCKQVPVERCTTSKQCDQVQVEKCERVPVETCDQVPNTKCRSIPQISATW